MGRATAAPRPAPAVVQDTVVGFPKVTKLTETAHDQVVVDHPLGRETGGNTRTNGMHVVQVDHMEGTNGR